MGVFAGPINYTTFYVAAGVERDYRTIFLEKIGQNRFTDINVDLDEEEARGWVTIENPLVTDFDTNSVFWGEEVLLTLRHDVIKLSPTSVQIMLRRECESHREKLGKEKLSKTEIEEIKDHLLKTLRRKALPSIKTYDMAWNVEKGLVRFWSTSKKVNEAFVDLFQETFGVQPNEKNPYSELERLDFDEGRLDAICETEPAALAAPASYSRGE